jgi:hypothetical protein
VQGKLQKKRLGPFEMHFIVFATLQNLRGKKKNENNLIVDFERNIHNITLIMKY